MSIPRKVHSQAVLRNLPIEKQDAIIEHIDGPGGNSLVATAKWLQADGIMASPDMVGNFRRWYLLRQQFEGNAMSALEMAKECKDHGWIETEEEERAAAQIFFNRMAMEKKDPKLWSLMQRINLSKEKVELDKKRLELETKKYQDKAGKGGKAVKKRKLTPEEKQKRIRQILGTE
jgi:hypothetical protein